MKLLFCKACNDIVKINVRNECICGRTKGRYLDNRNAEFSGPCIPIGIEGTSFRIALQERPHKSPGKRFDAFVIESNCKTFKEVKS